MDFSWHGRFNVCDGMMHEQKAQSESYREKLERRL